jgi:Flp pilus assembly protein TadG
VVDNTILTAAAAAAAAATAAATAADDDDDDDDDDDYRSLAIKGYDRVCLAYIRVRRRAPTSQRK